jgi:hypothetical protein
MIDDVLVYRAIHWNTGNAGRTCVMAGATLRQRRLRSLPVLLLMTSTLLSGCTDSRSGGPPAATPPATAVQAPATDHWLGQWTGPEGTFLRIAGGLGKYEITVQNLDGPRTFVGASSGDSIRFERDGVVELIRATNGVATGMKWLSEKANCLTVRPGEGYCRD